MYLLHDNATPHKVDIVKKFCESKRVTIRDHPHYSPDLSPCDFFLIPKLKKYLQGRCYRSRNGLGPALYQLRKDIPKEDYRKVFENWNKRLKLCVLHKREYFEGTK